MVKINKIIKILIGADVLLTSSHSFINPVFAIFLVRSIEGGTAQVAGTAVAVYWLTKSLLRVPLGWFLDKDIGEHDDFYAMITGYLVLSSTYFLFIFADTPTHIYLIQFLAGIAGAFAYTPWYGFFSRHLDRLHESFEWSIEVSLVGFGVAAAGFVGGFIAEHYGFTPIFILTGIFSFIGAAILFFIGKNIRVERKDGFQIKTK